MEQYRFKYYWQYGDPSYEEIPWGLSYTIFAKAYAYVQQLKNCTKIDVYKGDRLISTFYK